MIEIKALFEERKTDILHTLQLLEEIEKKSTIIKAGSSLKSSIFIMLYNLIEGVVTQSFVKIFEKISFVSDFSLLNNDIKLLYLKPHPTKIRTSSDILKFTNELSILHKQSFDKYSKESDLFSGNLDARKIRELLVSSLGVKYEYHCVNEERLLMIKNFRNQLAHGERSYSELGRDYLKSDIEKYSNATFDYLDGFIKIIEKYISEEGYLLSKVGSISYG